MGHVMLSYPDTHVDRMPFDGDSDETASAIQYHPLLLPGSHCSRDRGKCGKHQSRVAARRRDRSRYGLGSERDPWADHHYGLEHHDRRAWCVARRRRKGRSEQAGRRGHPCRGSLGRHTTQPQRQGLGDRAEDHRRRRLDGRKLRFLRQLSRSRIRMGRKRSPGRDRASAGPQIGLSQ